MNKTLAITVIVLVAVVMGMSTIAPMIQYAEANNGEPNPRCELRPGGTQLIYDPNSGTCVEPDQCKFGVDESTLPPHCITTPKKGNLSVARDCPDDQDKITWLKLLKEKVSGGDKIDKNEDGFVCVLVIQIPNGVIIGGLVDNRF